MADLDTLCGWGNRRKIAYFAENHEVIIPRRREQLATVVELLPWPPERELMVLDLGAGFGALTERLLERFPQAHVTCIDGSPIIIELAHRRLKKYGARVRILHRDLDDPGWREGLDAPFDCAISALAIHHLTDLRKRELYREIYELLIGGGIFLNDEIVALPLALKPRFEALGFRSIQEQDHARRGYKRTTDELQAEMRAELRFDSKDHQSAVASLRDQLRWLDEAGFESVDCYWKYLEFAIFGGVKP